MICFLFLSCKKDFLGKTLNDLSGQQIDSIQISQFLTVANAKDYFYSSRRLVADRSDILESDSIFLMMTYIKPLWEFAETIMYKGSIPILIVPIIQDVAKFPEKEAFLVFFLQIAKSHIDWLFYKMHLAITGLILTFKTLLVI